MPNLPSLNLTSQLVPTLDCFYRIFPSVSTFTLNGPVGYSLNIHVDLTSSVFTVTLEALLCLNIANTVFSLLEGSEFLLYLLHSCGHIESDIFIFL